FLKYKYRFINYLLSKNVNGMVKNIKNTLKGKKELPALSFTLLNIENWDIPNNCDLLNKYLINNEYKYLKKPLYDFLYLNMEHRNNVQVYRLNNAPLQFIFKGKKAIANLQFTA